MKEPRRDELRPSDKNDDDDDDNDDSIGGLGRRIRKLSSRTIEFCDSIDSIQVTRLWCNLLSSSGPGFDPRDVFLL